MSIQDQMDEEYAVAKRERAELQDKVDALAQQEYQAARYEVSRALATYRWWGWRNIVNSIRVAIQAWRQRRAARN